jgi:hypothetical protein
MENPYPATPELWFFGTKAPVFCLDAFSSREPVSTSLENAIANPVEHEPQPLALIWFRS